MQKPIYQPLDATGGHVRLLAIQPARSFSAPIRCDLIDPKLPLKPKYEALSYTWGGKDNKKVISLDGQDFRTLENLEAALHHLRRPNQTRTLWIDAICINQDDTKELGEQVVQMRQIYEQAERVLVWLGEPGDGGAVGMKSFATSHVSLSNGISMWKMQRKNGIGRSTKEAWAAGAVREAETTFQEAEAGEVAQLLDRPWWQRVWIIQEVVLAKKAVIMCGADEVPWESVKKKLRTDGVYGLQSLINSQPLLVFQNTIIEGPYHFPDANYTLLDDLQSSWRSGSWNTTLYDLMYRFRRFGCSDPKDRVYGFLGLAKDAQLIVLAPNYDVSTAQVYLDTARSLIASHKHLLIFNCKREPHQDRFLHQDTRIYSMLDQGKFIDPQAPILDAPGRKPRQGWLRLPEGWERRQGRNGWEFYDHGTKTVLKESPLKNNLPAPPQKVFQFRKLPPGWKKDWNNLGKVVYKYKPDEITAKTKANDDLSSLPSWVPNWNSWSIRDPQPFLSLGGEEAFYWASGKLGSVTFGASDEPDSSILSLKGMLFDGIKVLGPSWCVEPQNTPISRSGVTILKEWEELALKPVDHCPYENKGGRENAFWRTHIADYAGERCASEDDKDFFDAWYDHGGWTPKPSDVEPAEYTSMWQAGYLPKEEEAMYEMNRSVHAKPLERTLALDPTTPIRKILSTSSISANKTRVQEYKDMRTRIYNASVNRAMFVTTKGYLGLAPWNAREGDLICVRLGGSTPFLLRPVPGRKHFTLVGECYAYGIMGGELLGHEMGHARLRDFEIV